MGKRGNEEGSIGRRKSGGWCAQYTVYTSEGRKRRTLYGKTRLEVAAKLSKALADREGGLTFDAGAMTVGEYLARWLSHSVRDTVSQKTYERYESIVRVHLSPALGRIKLKALTPDHVRHATAKARHKPQVRPGTPRTRRYKPHPEHLLPRPARHGRRRSRRDGCHARIVSVAVRLQ
jgi:hypothetical protein